MNKSVCVKSSHFFARVPPKGQASFEVLDAARRQICRARSPSESLRFAVSGSLKRVHLLLKSQVQILYDPEFHRHYVSCRIGHLWCFVLEGAAQSEHIETYISLARALTRIYKSLPSEAAFPTRRTNT